MRAADLNTANGIVKRLAEINRIKLGKPNADRPLQFLVENGTSSQWVPLSKELAERTYKAAIAELDAEAAALRRRAAQINLSLS